MNREAYDNAFIELRIDTKGNKIKNENDERDPKKEAFEETKMSLEDLLADQKQNNTKEQESNFIYRNIIHVR